MHDKTHTVGFAYILTNKFMPGLVKIGFTTWLTEDRIKALYTTGVPAPFEIQFRLMISNPKAVENKTHKLLDAFRVNPKREFFMIDTAIAIETVRLAAIESAGIDSWQSTRPIKLSSGDRLSLSLEDGQAFALIALPHALSNELDVIDIWQAHSNGDQLEIFAEHSPTHVAGMSDYDPDSDKDPVPYLNRENNAANGMLNGREKLMPGDRLVWIPAKRSAQAQPSVVFEADDHAQIISRTWSPKNGPHGFPLILNDFLYDSPWPQASAAINAALNLPLPRTWAPRQQRNDEWAEIGIEPKPPAYWLPQLQPRAKSKKGNH